MPFAVRVLGMIKTSRLVLRPWRESDLAPFAEQNADPFVMRFLSGVLTRVESDAYVGTIKRHLADNGFCKWAVEVPGVSPFIGAVGLTRVKFDASFPLQSKWLGAFTVVIGVADMRLKLLVVRSKTAFCASVCQRSFP